jgi:hypothetical protein
LTDCAEALSLVEKLSDGEATAAEKRAAESHLEECSSCRGHMEYLVSLSKEARSMSFPEPPESYWQHLPRRVLDRIDADRGERSRKGLWGALRTPAMLRWGALGATLAVLVTVGTAVLREDSRTPAPPPPAAAQAPPPEARAAAEPSVPPPMARDEAPPGEAKLEPGVASGDDDRAAAKASPPAAPSEPRSGSEANESAGAADPRRLENENARALESANRHRAAAAPAPMARKVALEDCEGLRRAADSAPDGPGKADSWYRLAACSLERHERQAAEEELRKLAIEDADGFLALESAGPRADEIRSRLERIRPDGRF